ncbi:LPXTG cell wall anchor domain-containing protein [Antiquaquibacter soli]|uniref:LPXTG cell wall anchor domain-containing protein n=1 Tax=Antiquaquibacter soli TaxID=3064523 RepID=A0ABT9BKJ7_9MICO|nr:LPXTG cell wall anchor domain-containing protein [Protaetiibacter sp. WY-16]MDO7880958.1 LPXTG cell wall anchor domain-containing protein [Protaetiibacter sp. WY-16]
MTQRIRTAAVAIAGALGLLVAPVALAAPAAAAPLTQVLFFSNDAYTDVDEEDAFWIDGLEAAGATVTVFDGGDGSAAAWTAALTGQQVFAFPEHDDDLYNNAITEEAAYAIADWVKAGGLILASSDYDFVLTSVVTGIDYTEVPDYSADFFGPWPRLTEFFPGAPDALAPADGTTAYNSFFWTPEQLSVYTPLYAVDDPADEDNSWVSGLFRAGAGGVIYLGYDWYPSPGQGELQAAWNAYVEAILEAGIPPVAPPAPQLAATGSSVEPGLYVGGAALLLLAGAAVVIVARRKAAA